MVNQLKVLSLLMVLGASALHGMAPGSSTYLNQREAMKVIYSSSNFFQIIPDDVKNIISQMAEANYVRENSEKFSALGILDTDNPYISNSAMLESWYRKSNPSLSQDLRWFGLKHQLLPQLQAQGNGKLIQVIHNFMLYRYAQEGKNSKVNLILQKSVDPNVGFQDGYTPLHAAVYNDHIDVVRNLLAHGVALNKADDDGCTPLYAAVQSVDLEVAQELIKGGANLDQAAHDGNTPLHIAAKMGFRDTVKLLIQEGATIDKKNNKGRTPLYASMKENEAGVIDELIRSGSDIHTRDNSGCTPVMYAAKKHFGPELILLLDSGAAKDAVDHNGRTALYHAVQVRNVEAVNLLLQYGADKAIATYRGKTALNLATEKGYGQIVDLLQDSQSDFVTKKRNKKDAELDECESKRNCMDNLDPDLNAIESESDLSAMEE